MAQQMVLLHVPERIIFDRKILAGGSHLVHTHLGLIPIYIYPTSSDVFLVPQGWDAFTHRRPDPTGINPRSITYVIDEQGTIRALQRFSVGAWVTCFHLPEKVKHFSYGNFPQDGQIVRYGLVADRFITPHGEASYFDDNICTQLPPRTSTHFFAHTFHEYPIEMQLLELTSGAIGHFEPFTRYHGALCSVITIETPQETIATTVIPHAHDQQPFSFLHAHFPDGLPVPGSLESASHSATNQ